MDLRVGGGVDGKCQIGLISQDALHDETQVVGLGQFQVNVRRVTAHPSDDARKDL